MVKETCPWCEGECYIYRSATAIEVARNPDLASQRIQARCAHCNGAGSLIAREDGVGYSFSEQTPRIGSQGPQ